MMMRAVILGENSLAFYTDGSFFAEELAYQDGN
jgi:hypothetical protein